MTENTELRAIPFKNYIVAAVVVLAVLGISAYLLAWYNVSEEKKVSTSYLIEKKIIAQEITDLNEVDDVFSEAPNTYFIYVSYTGNKKVYELEKSLKNVINEYNLNEEFYFLNVTSIKDDDDCVDRINSSLKLTDNKIINLPTIIYVENGEVKSIIKRFDDSMLTVSDFRKMLESSNIEK